MNKNFKKSLSLLTAFLMLFCILPFQVFALNTGKTVPSPVSASGDEDIWDGSIAESFAGGTGTEEDPYLISNGAELAYLAQEVNGGNGYVYEYIKLTCDIYLNDTTDWKNWENTPPANEWTPIADGLSGGILAAEFDGDGHSVFGVYINKPDEDRIGLFGNAIQVIKNLGVEDSYICGNLYVGGIAGQYNGAFFQMSNCHNTGTVVGTQHVGGIVGWAEAMQASSGAGLPLERCWNSGSVSGITRVGGIVGKCIAIPIVDCYNTGCISSSGDDEYEASAGGIVCSYFGGQQQETKVLKCYNIGNIIGEHIGAIIGKKSEENAGISACYYLDTCIENNNEYGTPLTDEQMQVETAPENASNFEYFDFNHIWTTAGNPDYPYPELLGNEHATEPTAPPEPPQIWDGRIAQSYAGGTGTEGDPYLISDGAELARLAQQTNGITDYENTYFKMTSDIYLNDITDWENWYKYAPANEWIPIGQLNFKGNFDGGGHSVFGLFIPEKFYNGVIALFESNLGIIKNLGVEASYLQSAKGGIGGIVGRNYSTGTISNCYFTGIINARGNFGNGGIVGNNEGVVADCYNTGHIIGTGGFLGGIACGNSYSGTITRCFNSGIVEGDAKRGEPDSVGGIAGQVEFGGIISDCYNTGEVSGIMGVGGIVGTSLQYAGTEGNSVINCYNIGKVRGSYLTGGVLGDDGCDTPTEVSSCYYLDSCCDMQNSFGAALTDAEMQDSGNFAGFDFETTWTMAGNSDYPYPELISHEHIYSALGAYEPPVSPELPEIPVPTGEIWDGSIAAGFAGGEGTEEEPYLISNGAELAYFSQAVAGGKNFKNKYIALTADIRLNDTEDWYAWNEEWVPANEWTPIGVNAPFKGTFDGCGFAVYGVYINSEAGNIGLFGYNLGTIKNLGLEASYIRGRYNVGGIAGVNDSADKSNINIINCYNSGKVSGEDSVGGIVGHNQSGVTLCRNSGDISIVGLYESSGCGGIAGMNLNFISKCYNTGDIRGYKYIGGIAGTSLEGCISDCYNAGSLSGNIFIGGVAGKVSYGWEQIVRCYNIGNVFGCEYRGGVEGSEFKASIVGCYYLESSFDKKDSDQLNEGGGSGWRFGTSLTYEQMQQSESFKGFDFAGIWTMGGNPDYPYPELRGNEHALELNLPESIEADAVSLPEGKMLKLYYTLAPWNAVLRDCRFESDNEAVAAVDEKGMITGVSEGTAHITVISKANPEVSCIVEVNITPREAFTVLHSSLMYRVVMHSEIAEFTDYDQDIKINGFAGSESYWDVCAYAGGKVYGYAVDWQSETETTTYDYFIMDPETYKITFIGTSTDKGITAMAYDYSEGIMYAIVMDNSLYKVNLVNGALEYAADFTLNGETASVYGLAIDGEGSAYGLMPVTATQKFVGIDLKTGACSVIGDTGSTKKDKSFCTWDHNTGKLFMTSGNRLYTVNTSNGELTYLGRITDGKQAQNYSLIYLSGLWIADCMPAFSPEFPDCAVTFKDSISGETIEGGYTVPGGTVLNEADFPESPVYTDTGYTFDGWDYDGAAVYADAVITAKYRVTMGFYFETDPVAEGWTWLDGDGDGFNWSWVYDSRIYPAPDAPDGKGMMWSDSFQPYCQIPLSPDNWLISPVVKGGGNVSFMLRGGGGVADNIGIYVTADGGETWSDELDNYYPTYGVQTLTVDLSDFAGQDIRIGFRHYAKNGEAYVVIDAVEVFPGSGTPEPPTEPPTEPPVPTVLGYYFENDPAELWNWEDADGDGYNWQWMYGVEGMNYPEGQGMMHSQSYVNYVGALTPDNWLVSPIVSGAASVSFMFVGQDPAYASEVIGVYVSTDGGNTWSDELGYFTATGEVQTKTVDLSRFEGQALQVAFRHYDVTDQFSVNLDAVEFENGVFTAPAPEPGSPTEPPTEEPPTEEPPTEEPEPQEGDVIFDIRNPETEDGLYYAQPGETVAVEFTVTGEYQAHGANIQLNYDPDMLTVDHIDKGEVLTENAADIGALVLLDYETIPGSIRLGIVCSDTPLTQEGLVYTVYFTVGGNVELGTVIPLELEIKEFINMPVGSEPAPIPNFAYDGSIIVGEAPVPPTEPPTEEPPTEEPPTEEPPTEEPPTEEPPTEEPPTEEPPTEEPPTEEPPTEEPPTEEPPTEEPPTEEPPTEEPPTEEPPTEEPPTEEPPTPPLPPPPPTTGFISLAGAGVAAILAGAGIVLLRKKRK